MRSWSLLVVPVAISVIVAACGSSPASTFPGGIPDGGSDATMGPPGMLGGDSATDGGTSLCTPKTCAQLGYDCGTNADGCGGALDCGSCASPQFCGAGGYSKCGGNAVAADAGGNACVPTTCAQLGYTCGQNADGCGNTLNCGSCNSPQFCGGGGFSQCGGSTTVLEAGGNVCTPSTCMSLGYNCGAAGDGCGNSLTCGTCTSPQFCGGAGYDQCGGNSVAADSGGSVCTPKTCAQLGYNCGVNDDGCGNNINCGSCTSPQFCGGGGFSICGGNSVAADSGGSICTPTTCAALGYNCGVAGDGCGNTLHCGSCTSPQFCGGGGFNECGGNSGLADGGSSCQPKTCTQLGFNCGPAGDGCGNVLNCGSCTSPQFCGGGGSSICGPASVGGCDAGVTTSLKGFVYDPADNLPVYNALVYVPVGAVQTPQTGITPPSCGCTAPQAYASAFTGIDGGFTLTNVPAGAAVTVVVQLGKWQRIFTKPVTGCILNDLGSSHLTLPSTHAQGNIPRFAVDTGGVDSMECVLLKMGINQNEFVNPAIANGAPTAAGRVHFYEGQIVTGGAVINGTTPRESALTETASVMDSYDVLLFPCQGGAGTYNNANGYPNTLGNLVTYANNGGRAFATHFHYDLLDGNGTFSGTANWALGSGSWGNYYGDTPYNAVIDQTFARGATLASWLNQATVYGGTLGDIPVGVVRNDFTSVNAPAQRWMYTGANGGTPPANLPIHYTFDTPFNQSPTCGRVVYSDFHVESQQTATDNTGMVFPAECAGTTPGSMTPQEKLLEFMLFDLTSCVSPPTCTAKTCAQLGANCGEQGDGCGGMLNCGTCSAGQSCGGGGVANQCGSMDGGFCTPKTCAQQNIHCGPAGDGCGNLLQCGNCVSPQQCGGAGVGGVCGYVDGGGCTPRSCAEQGISCGPAGDGCGGQLSCGTCTPPDTCGGGGVSGACGYVDGGGCAPETCAQQGIQCGPAGDGCGNLIQCGPCTAPLQCGGGGQSGVCGLADGGGCSPESCQQLGFNCGPAGDGCGGLLQCGTCPMGQACGGGGQSGVCGSLDGGSCTPQTCQELGFNCGPAGDGCGGVLNCGTCSAPATCGGAGVAGQCGGGVQ